MKCIKNNYILQGGKAWLRILVVNDDGIYSKGLEVLAKRLSNIGEVFIVAPDRERSAISHAITFHHPIRVEEIDFIKNVKAWATSGTPVDCVKLALNVLLSKKPDIIVSGINKGANLGNDVFYSGTLSAAVEGALSNIPSLAVSLCLKICGGDYCKYNNAAKYAEIVASKLLKKKTSHNLVLNLNIPNTNNIKGTMITKLGRVQYRNCFVKKTDPRKRDYYWLAGDLVKDIPDTNTDVWAIRNNYISITPITLDLVNYGNIDILKNWNL